MKQKKKGALRTVVVVAAMAIAFLFYAMATWQDAGLPPAGEVIGNALAQDEAGEDAPTRMIDWEALPPEVVAWVEVPGTRIDEPIAQAVEGAPNAFLYRDALGGSAYGTPYIDWECAIDSPFVMVYGHHMSDGSVFADFARFADESYAREHGKIIVYKREGEILELEVCAAKVINASRERVVIDQAKVPTEIVSDADWSCGVADTRQLFAFATCSYQASNSRTVVYALRR